MEYLSLVSKICTELENHLGLNDKDVAEFIIDLANKNSTFDKFKKAIVAQGLGDQFDDSFITNLLRLIHQMQPKSAQTKTKKGSSATVDSLKTDSKEELKKKLPALALPNEPTKTVMAELESLLPKWKDDVLLDDFDEKKDVLSKSSGSDGQKESRKKSRSRSRERNGRRDR